MHNPLRSGGPGRIFRLPRELFRLGLADRCLFFLFLLLLAQSGMVLLLPLPASDGEIDAIVRTATASIFGYLLGGGMTAGQTPQASPPALSPALTAEPAAARAMPPADPVPPPAGECSRFRVLTVAGVGIFCLVTLLLLRDWPGALPPVRSESAEAVVVQFRDFISASLGFLTGCASRGGGRPS